MILTFETNTYHVITEITHIKSCLNDPLQLVFRGILSTWYKMLFKTDPFVWKKIEVKMEIEIPRSNVMARSYEYKLLFQFNTKCVAWVSVTSWVHHFNEQANRLNLERAKVSTHMNTWNHVSRWDWEYLPDRKSFLYKNMNQNVLPVLQEKYLQDLHISCKTVFTGNAKKYCSLALLDGLCYLGRQQRSGEQPIYYAVCSAN